MEAHINESTVAAPYLLPKRTVQFVQGRIHKLCMMLLE